MRIKILGIALASFAAAGWATPAAAQQEADERQRHAEEIQEQFAQNMQDELGQVLADPALPEKAGRGVEAVLIALQAMPIGQIEAAIEGRDATSEDMSRTLGDVADIDPQVMGQEVAVAIADNRHHVERGVDAATATLPALIIALETLRAEIEAIRRDY